MKFYFALQYRRLKHYLREIGINPYITFVIVIIVFVLLSNRFFQKIAYAYYIYPFFAIAILNSFGNKKRNEFLKNCFSVNDFRKIRLLENLLVFTPFFLFLLYKQQFIIAFSVYVIGALLSLFNKVNKFNFVIPTPFYKFPFEFTSGFRKTFWIFLLAYMLTYISISVTNFNLGIFPLIITFLTSMSFYFTQESIFFVWINSEKPAGFLWEKIKTAIFYSILISLPISLSLIIFFSDRAFIVMIFEILGALFVVTSLLGKYAYYPLEISLIPGFAIGFSFLFPPLLLVIISYFYSNSKQNLDSFFLC